MADPVKDYSKPPAQASPALPPAAYVGAYRNDFFGDIEVAAPKGALELRMGPRKTAHPLRHWDRDVFLYEPAGEMASGLSAVSFRIDPDRRAAAVVIDNLNVHGQGTFARVPAKK
jgi:hypothetical protein